MRVQINIHGDKDVSPAVLAEIEKMPRGKLERFGDLFTRLEIHFTRNEDAHARIDVYRCGIEAGVVGKRPIKVHHGARRPDLAAEGAVVKLITATERRVAGKRTVSRKGRVLWRSRRRWTRKARGPSSRSSRKRALIPPDGSHRTGSSSSRRVSALTTRTALPSPSGRARRTWRPTRSAISRARASGSLRRTRAPSQARSRQPASGRNRAPQASASAPGRARLRSAPCARA